MSQAIKSDSMVIEGDFNLPHLNWHNPKVFSGAACGLAAVMANFGNLFELTQTVLEPTRAVHILDLFLTNQPDLVKTTLVIPEISDNQSAVLCEMNLEYV